MSDNGPFSDGVRRRMHEELRGGARYLAKGD